MSATQHYAIKVPGTAIGFIVLGAIQALYGIGFFVWTLAAALMSVGAGVYMLFEYFSWSGLGFTAFFALLYGAQLLAYAGVTALGGGTIWYGTRLVGRADLSTTLKAMATGTLGPVLGTAGTLVSILGVLGLGFGWVFWVPFSLALAIPCLIATFFVVVLCGAYTWYDFADRSPVAERPATRPSQGLALHTSAVPIAATRYACTPLVRIDGGPVLRIPYGPTHFALEPGEHEVTVWARVFPLSHCGRQTHRFVVQPGELTYVSWGAPFIIFMDGTIRERGATRTLPQRPPELEVATTDEVLERASK